MIGVPSFNNYYPNNGSQLSLGDKGIVFPNLTQGDEGNSISSRLMTSPLQLSLLSVCNQTKPSESNAKRITSLRPEWDHRKICPDNDWIRFSSIGNFTEEDFRMYRPRHLIRHQSAWKEETSDDYLRIPEDFCVFMTNGWFTHNGALFDCKTQYPLIMKKDRKDLDLTIKTVSSMRAIKPRHHPLYGSQVHNLTNHTLYSLIIPFNDAFSHVFSTGVSMSVYTLYMMGIDPTAKVLIPSKGPFQSLLIALGVPSHRMIIPSGVEDMYYSNRVSLILRRPPFNIIQAHWPANALVSLQQQAVRWLVKTNHVDSDKDRNLVLFLWRSGSERSVLDQQALVDSIRYALEGSYELRVVGKDNKVHYNSDLSRTSWITTADLFVRAAAVIGPHGGAFGNTFLCAPDTTIIEFNLPWTSKTADGDSKSNIVRDLFYSMARAIGNTNYWNVWPSNKYRTAADFYHSKEMIIDGPEVVEILRRSGIAN